MSCIYMQMRDGQRRRAAEAAHAEGERERARGDLKAARGQFAACARIRAEVHAIHVDWWRATPDERPHHWTDDDHEH